MILLRDVTYTTPDISIKMVDCVLSMQWWQNWSNAKALLHITSRGLEYYILNNSARYDDLDRILKKRQGGAQEHGVQVGLEVPPDAPILFWLSKSIIINLSIGSVIIGNMSLPTALVISFQKARGTLSLIDKGEYKDLQACRYVSAYYCLGADASADMPLCVSAYYCICVCILPLCPHTLCVCMLPYVSATNTLYVSAYYCILW